MFAVFSGFFARYPLRAWFAALALGGFGVAAAGLQLQHLLSLSPCPYCIFQRVLYLLIGGLALLGFLMPLLAPLWALAIGGLALLGVGIAAYQTWMQAYPDLAPECGFSDPDVIERLVDWLGMEWPSLFMATGFCSSKEWVFLGLSMANWSLLLFAGIALYALLLGKRGN
ncbi:disulfide bond formation protein B [Azonexus sp.]|uniref:disulfide bond formation protein B n=1 Tax=Azonexus sp. TaxID=1872668 RepID=UPI0035AE05E1